VSTQKSKIGTKIHLITYNELGGSMKSKAEFKEFVRRHPELIKYVKSGEMNWQKFYELYCLYDEDNDAWNEFFNNNQTFNTNQTKSNNSSSSFGVGEIVNMFKNVKPEVLQQNINSIQKFLGFVSEFVGDKDKPKPNTRNIYTPRPTKSMFED